MSSTKKPTPYPDRPAILRAARTGDDSLFDRLTEEDRALYLLYREFPLAGEPALPPAPADWVHKAMAIPQRAPLKEAVRKLKAALTFDSWAGLAVAGTRSTATEERRLRFAAGDVTLDIRAEYRRGSWHFTARADRLESESDQPTLRADAVTVYVDTRGFYQWTSPDPPVRISLQSPSYLIELAEISWLPNSPK